MNRLSLGLAGLLILSVVGCEQAASPSSSVVPSAVALATSSLPPVLPSPSPYQGWRLLPTQADLGHARLYDMTTLRGVLVAIGSTDGGMGVIWSSTDGQIWKSIAGTTPLDGLRLRAFAVGDPGIVVVGEADTNAVILFSPDGLVWSREQVPGGHPGSSAISVAWGHGRFVAVGGGGEPLAAVSWSSADGRAWARISIIQEGTQSSLTSVVAGPDGFLADGMEGGRAALWASLDGTAWTPSSLPGSPTDEPGRLRYTGGHFILPVFSAGGVWSSTDARHWVRTTVPGFADVFDVTAIRGGFVAVGASSDTGAVAIADSRLTGWTLLPADPVFSAAIASTVAISPDGAYLVGVGAGSESLNTYLFADPSRLLSQ
jgi:hypothetical protein